MALYVHGTQHEHTTTTTTGGSRRRINIVHTRVVCTHTVWGVCRKHFWPYKLDTAEGHFHVRITQLYCCRPTPTPTPTPPAAAALLPPPGAAPRGGLLAAGLLPGNPTPSPTKAHKLQQSYLLSSIAATAAATSHTSCSTLARRQQPTSTSTAK